MALKKFRPLTPVLRYKMVDDFSELSKKEPEKALLEPAHKKAGRNVHGHITSRHRGGGHKRQYRIIDFKRNKHDIPGKVAAIEYDPNRSARIALIVYKDGEKKYIIAPHELKTGQTVISGPNVEVVIGNAMPVSKVPLGTFIHNIEMKPGKGGQLARTAGSYAEVVARENKYVQIKLPSSEIRRVREECYATIGQVSNIDHEQTVMGSAGRNRLRGWRPFVRGMVMNPVDHPNGGGEGRSKSGGGWHHLSSPWGNAIKGQKTRKRKNPSNRLIVKRRKGKKGR
jgi:large subunit ribosomal protein L2